MPYIITATGPYLPDAVTGEKVATVFRRTVATLDEAREEVEQRAAEHAPGLTDAKWGALVDRINATPEQGGTVGPLPDGTTITVAPA